MHVRRLALRMRMPPPSGALLRRCPAGAPVLWPAAERDGATHNCRRHAWSAAATAAAATSMRCWRTDTLKQKMVNKLPFAPSPPPRHPQHPSCPLIQPNPTAQTLKEQARGPARRAPPLLCQHIYTYAGVHGPSLPNSPRDINQARTASTSANMASRIHSDLSLSVASVALGRERARADTLSGICSTPPSASTSLITSSMLSISCSMRSRSPAAGGGEMMSHACHRLGSGSQGP